MKFSTPRHLWVIRAGSKAEFIQYFQQSEVIAIVWAKNEDLSVCKDRSQIRSVIKRVEPQQTDGEEKSIAGQIVAFIRQIKINDYVLVPSENGEKFIVGSVKGEYAYNAKNALPHVRSVQWISEFEKSNASISLRRALENNRIVYNADKHLLEVQKIVSVATELRVDFQRIQKFGLESFKAFNTLTEIPVAPLTVIAGINSSGKSSLFDSLLILRQTLLSQPRISVKNALELRGAFLEVDHFRELVYDKKNKGFSVQFLLKSLPPKEDGFSVLEKQSGISDIQEYFVLLKFQFSFNPKRDEVTVKTEFKVFIDFECENILFSLLIEPNGFQHRLELQIAGGDKMVGWTPIQFNRFFPVWEIKGRRGNQEEAQALYKIYSVFKRWFKPALETIEEELLNRMHYLGPLRAKPERIYLYSGATALDVGEGGAWAVELLARNWGKLVWFFELAQFEKAKVVMWPLLKPRKMILGEAINGSLSWLGMQPLRVKEIAENIVAQATLPTLSNPKTYVTIADVGFGVSQILPVITQCLLADVNDVLLLEQPEIHLHPYAQGKLAELLVCFARTGKRFIIETHSDHFINRLRRLIAEDDSDELQGLVNILFVRPPIGGEGAKIESLQVDKYGLIVNWPQDFLSESANDARAIIEASLRKRGRERKNV